LGSTISNAFPNASGASGGNRISSQPDLEPRALWKIVAALALLAVFFWLGYYVTSHPEPHALAGFALQLRGHGTAVAWRFTEMGWGYVLGPLYLALIVLAIFRPEWRMPALFAVVTALICWGAASEFQHFFNRPRRTDWLIRHETAGSYPSSHAAISTGFYFLCGLLALRSQLTAWLRYTLFTLLTLLTLAIIWSRIELAAHNITDVIGGVMLALAIILLGEAVLEVARRPVLR
jgi:membrane-associated phospholipid phosphatase